MTGREVLAVPMETNDSGATTIRGYLVALVRAVLAENEGFSGKRPFGNSGWEWDLYVALGRAGAIRVRMDEEGDVEDIAPSQQKKADGLLRLALDALAVESVL